MVYCDGRGGGSDPDLLQAVSQEQIIWPLEDGKRRLVFRLG